MDAYSILYLSGLCLHFFIVGTGLTVGYVIDHGRLQAYTGRQPDPENRCSKEKEITGLKPIRHLPKHHKQQDHQTVQIEKIF
jgi:hypothetical protein